MWLSYTCMELNRQPRTEENGESAIIRMPLPTGAIATPTPYHHHLILNFNFKQATKQHPPCSNHTSNNIAQSLINLNSLNSSTHERNQCSMNTSNINLGSFFKLEFLFYNNNSFCIAFNTQNFL
jgi:hypothetical protein